MIVAYKIQKICIFIQCPRVKSNKSPIKGIKRHNPIARCLSEIMYMSHFSVKDKG